MTENDQIRDLLAAFAEHEDQAAYKALFLLLHARLKKFAFAILKSEEEAEELVSDIFIGIWQKKDTLTTIEAPLFYFYTAAKNLAINRLKKQQRQSGLSPDEWLVQLNSIYFNPELLLVTEEMVRQIKKAVDSLPPRCKLIFKLIKEDGLKYREVAELMQLSKKTIEAQMAIALRRVAKCMHIDLGKNPHPRFQQKK